MGQYLKICEGNVFKKMADSLVIFALTFAILILEQFSLRRMMRLEQTHRVTPVPKPTKGVFRN